jgi:selenocysteine-specific elongation factor
MRVIGTAGHVDHGKSRLVYALTGIDPDRLREEQERQMTIDLGFAWMTLPNGESIGIIDVPGHRDFIENMLAGVGGIDAALLVIAADEGVMPQTREHLAILDLLDIKRGVIALSKIDLIEDKAWLELVLGDIKQVIASTHLADAQIVPVSVVTAEGLDLLIAALSDALQETHPRQDLGRPRLSIDRAFTISGFGTVVTGTLLDGILEVGQEIEILPVGLRGRIRGLQTHKTQIEQALPGSRVAVNLTGVEVREISRGDVVSISGLYEPTRLLDVHFRLLPDAVGLVQHDQQVKIFLGAAQRLARVRLLRMEPLHPGEEGWMQISLIKPLIASRGDHFILRRPSPGATLGGGRVANAHPTHRHRRKDTETVKRLESLLRGTPEEVLVESLMSLGPAPLRQVIRHAGLETERAQQAIEELLEAGKIQKLGDGSLDKGSDVLVVDNNTWGDLHNRIAKELHSFHEQNPLRMGMPREELKSRLKLEGKVFTAVLNASLKEGCVVGNKTTIRSSEHTITLSNSQEESVETLLNRFHESPHSPPSVKECMQAVGTDILTYLLENGTLIQLSPDVVFSTNAYDDMVTRIRKALQKEDTITVAKVRDLFKTSRKYALALMEYLDSVGITVREGDERRLVKD